MLRLKHAVFDKLVYAQAAGRARRPVRSRRCPVARRWASGCAHFFRGVGMPVYEGYGLTETSAAACVDDPRPAQRVGTRRPAGARARRCGSPRTARSCSRATIVFRGYWNNEAATKEAIEDGWFHTGDIGELDDDGFLTITGRKKEIIVTAGGKNVSPARARGPPPGAPADQRSAWSSATSSRSSAR